MELHPPNRELTAARSIHLDELRVPTTMAVVRRGTRTIQTRDTRATATASAVETPAGGPTTTRHQVGVVVRGLTRTVRRTDTTGTTADTTTGPNFLKHQLMWCDGVEAQWGYETFTKSRHIRASID